MLFRSDRVESRIGGTLVGVLSAQALMAQGNSSLSESKVESQERGVTSSAFLAQDEDLRKQLSIAQESVKTLTISLAESNAEAELFRRKYSDLELRMEGAGIAIKPARDRAKPV